MLKASEHPNDNFRTRVSPQANAFTDALPARIDVLYGPALELDWGWLKIERVINTRFSHPERHITIKLPWKRRRFFAFSYDNFCTGRPALFVAFGHVPLAKGGWHARGAILHVDIKEEPFEKELGYKNPINLANY